MTPASEIEPPESTIFVDPVGRSRRPADVVKVVIGLLLVAITGLSFRTFGSIEGLLIELVEALPVWTGTLFRWTYAVGTLYGLALLVGALLKGRHYLGVVRDMLLALVGSIAAVALIVLVVAGEWPRVFPEFAGDIVPQYLPLRVAAVTGTLAAAAAHLTRPYRRLSWLVVLTAALAAVGLGYAFPTHALGAIGVGIAVAGLINVVFGSPDGFPNPGDVAASLRGLGLEATDLRSAERESWGVRRFTAASSADEPIHIKVYGRDASDAQLWSKLRRFIWYRDSGPELAYSRLQQVEHEALMHFMARDSGATVATVLTATSAGNGDAVLALGWEGTEPTGADAGLLSDQLLHSLWADVARLHEAGLSHGRLNLSAVRLIDESLPVISEFDAGSVAATEARISSDVAELLFATAVVVGPDRAVAAAASGLGEERLADAAPYLQTPAISAATLGTSEDAKALLESLRGSVAERTGSEVLEPAELKRVTGRDLLKAGLFLFAGYLLITQLASLDWAAIIEDLRSAQWVWVAVAFFVGQVALFPEAISMMSAVERQLPMMPSVVLQSASRFVSLAIPGPAGRIATNVTYLRRHGVAGAEAVTQGGVDSLAGLITEIVILVSAVLFANMRLDLSTETEPDWVLILGVVVGIVAVALAAVTFIPALRDRIVPIVKDAWRGLSVVFREPTRLIWMFGAHFITRIFYGAALWLVLQAFGVRLPLVTTVFVTVAASLLAAVIPVPGGVGVAEAAVAAGLVGAGLDENLAFSVAVTYRVAVFYVPPVLGFFSLRWLEGEGYL